MTLPNELHPGFFSAAGGGDVGDTIEQSLRFRGGQRLRGNFASTEWTISSWVKLAVRTSQVDYIWSAGTSGIAINSSAVTWYDGSNFTSSTALLRDPSAWYHIVANKDTVYLNGQTLMSITGINLSATSDDFNVGAYSTNTLHLNGYQASFIAIDGQKLDPTDFGKYNEDGVWVPQNYTGSYGTNGYNLTFDSSQTNGIGHDSSGNGNNFTASGFDTADARVYSKDLYSMTTGSGYWATTTSKNFSSNTPPTGFNGNTGDYVQVGTGDTWVWRPSYPLTATLVEVFPTNSSPNQKLYFNGTEVGGSYTGAAWNTVYTGSATTVNHIGGEFTGGGNGFSAIRVNGTILVDNFDNDVDYNDTPTSNYATWNPLSALAANVTFTDANLRLGTIASQAWTPGYLTFGPFECGKPGKYYFEMNDDIGTGYKTCNFGVTDNLSISWSDWWWNTGNTLSWYPESGTAYRNGSSFSFSSASTSGGKAMAIDFEAGTINAYNAGSLVGSLTGSSSNLTAGTKYYIVAATSNSNSTTMPFNFGQMPFIYTPPDGYKALQTNNLPEPTIKNGKEYFEAKLYSGTGSSNAITGLEFSPDLIWIKVRDAADNHVLVDTIRGTDSVLFSNSTDAEASSFSRFTSFDSNGFTVDTTDTAWNNSANDYVAWCWEAGGAPTATNSASAGAAQTADSVKVDGANGSFAQGTIKVNKLSANTTAGFSIATYTGTGSAGTIPHGLGAVPEWALLKRTDGTGAWSVYHKSMGNQNKMKLNESDQMSSFGTGTDIWNGTSPTSSLFSIGVAGDVNTSSEEYIAYMWSAVEQFSKFGEYTANGNADGPFVYTGFTPAFIILKTKSGANGSWQLYDTARDTSNPNTATLVADGNPSEVTSGNDLDILSNGFKPRDNGSINNGSGNVYLYMAFAENPFGGENAPPATGR